MNDHSAETELIQAYRDMYRGMINHDPVLLDELLDENYTLTHMTGYRQSRAEWIKQVDHGEMTYHQSQEQDVEVEITGHTAVVVGRNIVDATIWGSRGTWPLQLTTHYKRHHDTWIALHTTATTF